MRTFTETDKTALAVGFQAFMRFMNGQRTTVKGLLPLVIRALDEGLTADELLNRNNYYRLAEMKPKASAEEYVDALIGREMVVKSLKNEPDWDESINFPILAEVFHDAYMEICPKGGTWTTDQAKNNLRKVILRYSLQAIISEALIVAAKEKTGEGGNLTCFQYVQTLLHDGEDYDVDTSLSEAQQNRRELEEAMLQGRAKEGTANGEGEQRGEGENPDINEQRQAEDPNELRTEGVPGTGDSALYPEGFGDPEAETGPGEEETLIAPEEVYVAAINPQMFKRQNVAQAVKTLTIPEINALYGAMEKDDLILDDFITELAKGNIDTERETIEAREAHQVLISNLVTPYMQCIKMQGGEVSEEALADRDLIKEVWDIRDDKTRRLQKMRDLVYQAGRDSDERDPDLEAVLKDLEKLYGYA